MFLFPQSDVSTVFVCTVRIARLVYGVRFHTAAAAAADTHPDEDHRAETAFM